VLLAVTTPAFDIAALELLLPLLAGGRVEIASREVAADPALLAAAIDRTRPAALQATPATWRMLLDAGWPGDPGLLALCGGEALPADLASRLLPRVRALWNLYGPTETTVWSAARPVEEARRAAAIGGPIANTRLHVLGAHGEELPLGVPGELLIGGAGVARGYLGRPDLTAERFRPDPFAAEPGARAYLTGDLVRRLPDGTLDFLGRLDHQVKVRGFRIETGEVEAALAAHPRVRQAAVVARTDDAGGGALVAYLVAVDGAAGETEGLAGELRPFLAGRLPESMVPSAFVVLPSLPLTPSGKLDRRALPPPGAAAAAGAGDEPPATPAERALAAIWSGLLEREPIGRRDSFFDLGGHSLLATRMLARVREEMGAELSLRRLFEAPTLVELAQAAEGAAAPSRPAPPPIRRAARERYRIDPVSFPGPAPTDAAASVLAGEEGV
jgi:acyl-coenzyme A synthetase/AMP-(fatty) acid ligase